MDLSFYLVELLRMHDCVIVPDLGGFVANYRPAGMDLNNNNFIPPVKEIIFSGKLTKNDGLLVNFISEVEGVGYLESRRIIAEFVAETWSKLENGDQIKFKQLGSLFFDRNEKLIFEVDVHDNFLLDAYGMESFQFPLLERAESISAKRLFTDKEAVRPVFNSRRVKALVVGVPLVLALIFIPVAKFSPKLDGGIDLQSSSTTSIPLNAPISQKTMADTISFTSPEQDNELVHRVDSTTIEKKETVQPVVVSTVQSHNRYRLIGGCFNVRDNAENFVKQLHASGYKSEIKIQPNGAFLVIVQSYSNQQEATKALTALRQADPNVGYWMSIN